MRIIIIGNVNSYRQRKRERKIDTYVAQRKVTGQRG